MSKLIEYALRTVKYILVASYCLGVFAIFVYAFVNLSRSQIELKEKDPDAYFNDYVQTSNQIDNLKPVFIVIYGLLMVFGIFGVLREEIAITAVLSLLSIFAAALYYITGQPKWSSLHVIGGILNGFFTYVVFKRDRSLIGFKF